MIASQQFSATFRVGAVSSLGQRVVADSPVVARVSTSDRAAGARQCSQQHRGAEAGCPAPKLRPTLAAELGQPIYDGIALAEDAHVLLFIDRAIIPNAKHLLWMVREDLHAAVRARFGELNAAAVQAYPRGGFTAEQQFRPTGEKS